MALTRHQRDFLKVVMLRVEVEARRGVIRPSTLALQRKALDMLDAEIAEHPDSGDQLAIDFHFKRPQGIKRRGRPVYARYPFQMVLEARKLRARKVEYKEIAADLAVRFGITVSWVTVRDWTVLAYRVTG